jgi:hypothetical protein
MPLRPCEEPQRRGPALRNCTVWSWHGEHHPVSQRPPPGRWGFHLGERRPELVPAHPAAGAPPLGLPIHRACSPRVRCGARGRERRIWRGDLNLHPLTPPLWAQGAVRCTVARSLRHGAGRRSRRTCRRRIKRRPAAQTRCPPAPSPRRPPAPPPCSLTPPPRRRPSDADVTLRHQVRAKRRGVRGGGLGER